MKECVSFYLPTDTNITIHIIIHMTVVMDDEVVNLGMFQIIVTNYSPKHVRINNKVQACLNHVMKKTYISCITM